MLDLTNPTTQTTLLLSVIALLLSFLLFQPTGFVKWLQKKNYQYEVTFSLYMLTPTEKFVFNSILFLTFSLFLIASVIYLPNHILTMSRRTYYYFAGDNVNNTLAGGANGVAERVYGTASEWAQTAYQTAFNRTGSAGVEKVVEKASEVVSAAAESSSAAAVVAEGARNAAQQVVEGN
ncbi:hypothetical protein CB0940_02456 [Cercospora beticola]|uniref:Uncharacterized protein n=1 Tax=Cercospora beticola TaxID=122368 RepID=A0A2G5I5H7_CERBT|nr:hypothetical protein CB0940_02456 [Cercospora beticola]PIA99703.1 hypothetical protein CB0940_02456 [Cercospora beticola]WPA99590.1 hypothetical protein RHO25_004208 [Cercospora beticola]CAK1362269.1 unnamed protein product [Cercospora beticola]